MLDLLTAPKLTDPVRVCGAYNLPSERRNGYKTDPRLIARREQQIAKRKQWLYRIETMLLSGMTDQQIGEELGAATATIARARTQELGMGKYKRGR